MKDLVAFFAAFFDLVLRARELIEKEREETVRGLIFECVCLVVYFILVVLISSYFGLLLSVIWTGFLVSSWSKRTGEGSREGEKKL